MHLTAKPLYLTILHLEIVSLRFFIKPIAARQGKVQLVSHNKTRGDHSREIPEDQHCGKKVPTHISLRNAISSIFDGILQVLTTHFIVAYTMHFSREQSYVY